MTGDAGPQGGVFVPACVGLLAQIGRHFSLDLSALTGIHAPTVNSPVFKAIYFRLSLTCLLRSIDWFVESLD